MALGGGTFINQNKILPGTYIKVGSQKMAKSALSDRGIVALPIELDWGKDGVFKVTGEDLIKDSVKLFGYSYTDEKLTLVREVFENARIVYFYKINSGEKATSELASAKYSGVRGNDITIVVTKTLDKKFKVETLMDTLVVDEQVVESAEDLKDNDYVVFTGDTLEETAGVKLAGGTNKEKVTGEDYQKFLNSIDTLHFNALGCPTGDEEIKSLFVAFTKRMRTEVGAYFQTVIFNSEKDYDDEGIIILENRVTTDGFKESDGVYWLTGATGGVAVNKSLTNTKYTGELDFDVSHSQLELESLIEKGRFVMHQVDLDSVHVLMDINSFTSFTDEKNEGFAINQNIRLIDDMALNVANLFNSKYLGNVPNDESGRESLWNDVLSITQNYINIRAIANYDSDELVIFKGDGPGDVGLYNAFRSVVSMTHLYFNMILTE